MTVKFLLFAGDFTGSQRGKRTPGFPPRTDNAEMRPSFRCFWYEYKNQWETTKESIVMTSEQDIVRG